MSFLKNDLLNLKGKLENLEFDLDEKLKDVEEKSNKFVSIDQTIEDLVSKKENYIKLDIGGKVYKTKLSTLLSVKNTLFYKLIKLAQEKGEEELSKEFFFDRSYMHFPFILDYLRTTKFSLKGLSKFDLDDIEKEVEYYGLIEILEKIQDLKKEVEFVSMDAAPRYSNAGTHNVQDLKDKSMTKGVCVGSPYHIIIELNFEHEIDAIEVSGWNGNSSLWYVGNGSGCRIYTSTDKSNWKEVGTLPSNHGATIQTVKLTPSTGKYIKFQHTSYLGLGYLNVLRKK